MFLGPITSRPLPASRGLGYHSANPPGYHAWDQVEGRMRVPDLARKSVVFIGKIADMRFVPYGTGFIVCRETDGLHFNYIVTARHVLDLISGPEKDGDTTVAIRINLKAGGSEVAPSALELWHFHPGPKPRRHVDVAVLPVPISSDLYDFARIPLDDKVATPEIMQAEYLGVGTDVYITGLFTRHWGDAQNVPLVRCGNIARMAEEPLYTPDGYMDAYLIEAKSIGGLSGSPVFAHMPPIRVQTFDETHKAKFFLPRMSHYLLGMVQGHFVVENSEDAIVESDQRVGQINTGIAVVVPVQSIIETVDHPALLAARVAAAEAKKRGTGLVRDAAALGVTAPEPAYTPAESDAPGEDDDWRDPAETVRLRDEMLRRTLNTPPKPRRSRTTKGSDE